MLSRLLSPNLSESRVIDRLVLTLQITKDGNTGFQDRIATLAPTTGAIVYDVCGGSQPFATATNKVEFDRASFDVEERYLFWSSGYFRFFLPA